MIGRSARSLAIAAVAALGAATLATAPRVAHAQSEPSKEDLEQAKKAYAEGKAFFAKGKYDKAVEKFKESYRLSKRPALLYNIALTLEKLGTKDMALFYYKKFLSDAAADDPQRPAAEASAAALEKDQGDGGGSDTTAKPDGDGDGSDTTATSHSGDGDGHDTTATPDGDGDHGDGDGDGSDATPPPDHHKKKRTAAATASDFQHQVVDEAPPGKPLDLTASVPEDAGWEVILFYRGAGDDKFVSEPMKTRYHDLYARIPAKKMTGNAIQYYIEVKDADGKLVTRVGKATSPNVVYLDPSAKPRYFPDVDDPDDTAAAGGTSSAGTHDDDDNPLTGAHHERTASSGLPPDGGAGGTPEGDGGNGGEPGWGVGSSKFRYMKWGTTGVAGGALLLGVTFYFMASSWSASLEGEASVSNSESCTNGPPCRPFDEYRANIEATGKRYNTLTNVFLITGLVAGAAAGYLWYDELHAPHHERRVTTSGLHSLVAAPVASDGFVGGAAGFRF